MNERIKEIRKALSLTLEEFGKELGVTRSAIGHIENGIRNITEQMILSICREFNVNEEWLRYGNGKMFESNPKTELEIFCKKYKLNQLESAILEKYLNLSNIERKAVFNFVMDIFNELNKTNTTNSTILANTSPEYKDKTTGYNNNLDKLSIDEKVELYRQELEYEKKVAEKLKASPKNA